MDEVFKYMKEYVSGLKQDLLEIEEEDGDKSEDWYEGAIEALETILRDFKAL